MNNKTIIPKFLSALAFGALVTALLVACSDDKPKTKTVTPPASAPKTAVKANHNPNPWDHSGEIPVTDKQKHQFEQQFAEQCIKRETESAGDGANPEQLSTLCNCVAQFMAKTLTPQEAEKFLDEHENPHSLEIKYENAAYHCLQQKQPPHGPDFSHKP